jgi:glutaredoxin
MLRVTLYTRQGCHLCEEAKAVLGTVLPDYAAALEEIDVDGDPHLRQRFGEEVPVVCIEGRKAFKFRVTEPALRRKLALARLWSRLRPRDET